MTVSHGPVLKILYDQAGCIGCAVCEKLSPTVWEMVEINGEPKAILKKEEISGTEIRENKEGAECCPTQVIHLVDPKTGKEISAFDRSQYHEQSPDTTKKY